MYKAHLKLSAKRARQHQQATVEDHEDVDEDGILIDIAVQPITDESGPTREDRTRDIDNFFSKPFERTNTNGTVKKHRKCKVCPYVIPLSFPCAVVSLTSPNHL